MLQLQMRKTSLPLLYRIFAVFWGIYLHLIYLFMSIILLDIVVYQQTGIMVSWPYLLTVNVVFLKYGRTTVFKNIEKCYRIIEK